MVKPGSLIVTRFEDQGSLLPWLRIDHADPMVWISDEQLGQIKAGHADPQLVRYDPESAALTIIGKNLTVIYRVTDQYDAERRCHLMVWPD